jgi:TatA/E family protein of Tat protein translocase
MTELEGVSQLAFVFARIIDGRAHAPTTTATMATSMASSSMRVGPAATLRAPRAQQQPRAAAAAAAARGGKATTSSSAATFGNRRSARALAARHAVAGGAAAALLSRAAAGSLGRSPSSRGRSLQVRSEARSEPEEAARRGHLPYTSSHLFFLTLKTPLPRCHHPHFSQETPQAALPPAPATHDETTDPRLPPPQPPNLRVTQQQTSASLFGVGAPEALVIGVVALLVFGPKGLADIAKQLGGTLRAFQPTIRELQEVSREFKSTLEDEIGLDEIRNPPPVGSDGSGGGVSCCSDDDSSDITDITEFPTLGRIKGCRHSRSRVSG